MLLSIITINYNNIEGLRKTVDSVLCQKWKDFEWIFIDGGSTDGSKELIERIAKGCPNVSYWCSEQDKGIYNAMNKGIQKAKGVYLNFMNSGDCFADAYSLQKSSQYFISNDDIYYADANFFDKKGRLIKAMRLPNRIGLMFYIDGKNISHQASFIKRSLLYTRPYNESYKIAGDGEFFFYALLHDYSFKHIPYVIVSSDMPGISSNIDDARLEVKRMLDENISKVPVYKRFAIAVLKLTYIYNAKINRVISKICSQTYRM